MFKLGFTKSDNNFNFDTRDHNKPYIKTQGNVVPNTETTGNRESLYPAFLPAYDYETNLFPPYNPHGFFNDYRIPPPVNYRGLRVEDVDMSKKIIVTDPREDEEPGKLNTFNTKPGKPPIMDALRKFLENRQVEDQNDPTKNMRDEIISRLKSHGLYKDQYGKLGNNELRTLATNLAATNNLDPNELIPKNVDTQNQNVASADDLVNQPQGSQQQKINQGFQPTLTNNHYHSNLRRTVNSNGLLEQIRQKKAARKRENVGVGDDTDSIESADISELERLQKEREEQQKAEEEGRSASSSTGEIPEEIKGMQTSSLATRISQASEDEKPFLQKEMQNRSDYYVKEYDYNPSIGKDSLWKIMDKKDREKFGGVKTSVGAPELYFYLRYSKGLSNQEIKKKGKRIGPQRTYENIVELVGPEAAKKPPPR